MTKIKVELTIATGQFENAKPTIEVEIPDNLSPVEQFYHLYDMFHDLTERRPSHRQNEKTYPKTKWGKIQARKDGVDIDNDPYLDGEEDEGAKIENSARYQRA